MLKVFKHVLIFTFLILPVSLLAKSENDLNEKELLSKYYQYSFVGEKKIGNYSGAIDSRASYSSDIGEYLSLDDQFNNKYLNEQIQSDALELQSFWFKKIIEKSTCPDLVLSENIDYIRYIYRLLTMSYLYESLKINNHISSEIGSKNNICSLKFSDVFGKCKPKSDDMKKFFERISGKFSNDNTKTSTNVFSNKELNSWLENFKHSTSLSIDPVHARLHDWCYSQKKNCRTLTVEDVHQALGEICNNDKSLLQNICSETDDIYGTSYVDKAPELIQTSSAFSIINHNGMGEDCLRRYIKVFTSKEVKYNTLNRQFPLIYSQLVRENSRYLQGELFLPGALKEFDMKGLSDFLVALKPPKSTPEVKPLPPKKIPPVVVAKIIPKPKEIVTKPIEVAIVKPVVEVVKISEFQRAVTEFEEKNLASLSINMDKFHDDFEFSQQLILDLAAPLKKFQTREALTDMKSFDHLGNSDAPVGLIFLKYLIDTDNHQGLYNVVSVLGNKFYVSNDIEKLDKPIFIELRNDESTKNHWQIILQKKMP